MFTIAIKSGTSGWDDYDHCDKVITEIPSDNVPNVDDTISFNGETYLVRSISRIYYMGKENKKFEEYIWVYVIKI